MADEKAIGEHIAPKINKAAADAGKPAAASAVSAVRPALGHVFLAAEAAAAPAAVASAGLDGGFVDEHGVKVIG